MVFEMIKEILAVEAKEETITNLPHGIFIELSGVNAIFEKKLDKRQKEIEFYREIGAYMTDIVPTFSEEEYNIMFLPINSRLSRSELKIGFLNIYKEILPSFKDKKKYIIRLTEEVDGLI